MRASASPGAAKSTEKAATTPGQHFKRSPTLLFDILVESDRDKQQRKLQQATLPPAAADQSDTAQEQELLQHGHLQPDPAKCVSAPATSDLPAPSPAKHRGEGFPAAGCCAPEAGPATAASDCGAAAASEPGGSASDLKQVAEKGGQTEAESASSRQQQQHVQVQGQQRQRQEDSGVEAAAATGAAAGAGGLSGANATAPAVPVAMSGYLGPPVRDILAEFTPRVILQELLGELFIPPERLTQLGTFGTGAFATVQSCGLEMVPGGPSLTVAVKSLKPQVLSDLEDLRRFLLEANLVRKLHHPNIVSIHGLGAHDLSSLESLRKSAYVVMEALQGGDLRMMLLRQMTSHSPAYSRVDALRWCTHIAAACAYLHETCRPMVIHRDLKPENVMLTGGPVDGRVAKITDFGLHKRARYNRTEDVLIAVTNEWSTRGGSVYRGNGMYGGGAGGTYGGGSVKAGGTVRGGNRADLSTYGGSIIDASYYGGNTYIDTSSNWSASAAAAMAAESNGNGSYRPGLHGNRSTSARYAALATAGLAAATIEATTTATIATANGLGGGRNVVSLPHRVAHNNSVVAPTAAANGGVGGGGGDDEGMCVSTDVTAAAGAAALADAGGSTTGPASSLPPGESLRAGSEAAAELGIAPQGKLTERERPYLLAYDKRYDTLPNGGSKWSSSTDLLGMNDAAVAAAAAAVAATVAVSGGAGGAPPSPPLMLPPSGGSSHPRPPPPPQHQPMGWTPPNVVPPASLEESVHRKMLALMALESAAVAANLVVAAAAAAPAGVVPTGASGAAAAAPTAAGPTVAAAGPEPAPFSVTEFVRAAAAAAAASSTESSVGLAPSAVMLMRSMSLALQQQQQETLASSTSTATITMAMPPPLAAAAARAAARAAFMKTVPENNRMSMDVGSLTAALPAAAGNNGAAVAAAPMTAAAHNRASALAATSGGKRHADAAHRREKVASAAARMADATRQVGSLVYMAPELVLSGNYNEKVDVFSFAIIAYELFTGKLLAMKIANEYACQLEQQGGSGAAAARGARAGPGGLPAGPTRSAEEDAEAGVMSYVMRRCGGSREPLPSWWPAELRALIAACWAEDPADRPSFSQIHRQLRKMHHAGTVADMDARDPLRDTGCGCIIA